MTKRSINGLGEFISALAGYCDDGLSGTLYFTSNENSSARLVIENGRILSVSYKQFEGMDAIDELREITIGRLGFVPGMVLKSGAGHALPDTDNLLRLLAKRPIKKVPAKDEVKEEVTAETESDYKREDVVTVLSEEAMEYLGPIASRLSEHYLEGDTTGVSRSSVIKAMNRLSDDIAIPDRKNQFMEKVKRRLQMT